MNKKIILILSLLLLVLSVSFAVAHDDSNNTDKLADPIGHLTVDVVWDDNGDTSKRPESIHAGFKGYDDDLGSFYITSGDGWSKTWGDLDNYQATDEVSLEAQDVEGYTVKVTGSLASHKYTITYTLKETPKQNSTNGTDKTPVNDSDKNITKKPVKDPVKKSPSKKTTSKPVKKDSSKKQVKKVKDKHNTGNPILLGVLAVSAAGLAMQLRRRE